MRRTRLTLVACVLVVLNAVLWLAPPGLAAHKVVVTTLLGPKLVRAEALDSTGGSATVDWRIDRGVVTQLSSTQLTLREADGRSQVIQLSSSTKVTGKLRSAVKRGWRALVTWQANGAANTVQVEAHGSAGKGQIAPLFGASLVRGEVIDTIGGGSTSDWRIDRGVITSAGLSQLTLQEADGRSQVIQLSSSTKVTGSSKVLSVAALKNGWRVLVTWPANGAADSVKVESRGSGKGGGGGARPQGEAAAGR